MSKQVWINHYSIEAEQVHIEDTDKGKKKISMTFKVEHQDYHDVTTLLYENDFQVKVPSQHISFPAVIHHYSTSIDNLYKEGAVGTFYLDLIEKY